MIVFPAIDLKQGQVVRLAEGDMARATVYGDDPVAQALLFAEAGSQYLHVVDLDGSFAGRAENRAAVEAILDVFSGHVQLGGGIRTREAVEGWFDLGVARIVMGTAALKDPSFVRDMAEAYPGGIVVAVDAKDGMVATEGWAEVSDMPAVDLARRFEDAGVAAPLFTDIGRDGLLKGVNIDATVDLARRVDIPVIASGGVKGLDDIVQTIRDVRGLPVLTSLILLAGAASFFIGNSYQAQMPGFATDLGNADPGIAYTALLGADAAGALVGGLLLESGRKLFETRTSSAIVLAMLWGAALGAFGLCRSYPLALGLLFAAGFCELSFSSMNQTIVQMQAPNEIRGRVLGLFNMASAGLRTFSGITVGLLGSVMTIHTSLALASVLFVATAGLLLLRVRSALPQG